MPISSPSDARRVPLWSLRDDVLVEADPAGDGAVLLTRWGELRLRHVGAAAVETLRRLTFGPVHLDNVVRPGTPERDRLDDLLDGLQHLLVRSLGTEDGMGPLLSVVPLGRQARFRPDPGPPDRPVRLARAAAVRTDREAPVLESPRAVHRVVLHHPVARAVAAALDRPTSAAEVAAALGLPPGLTADLIGYLTGTGMVEVCCGTGK